MIARALVLAAMFACGYFTARVWEVAIIAVGVLAFAAFESARPEPGPRERIREEHWF